MNKIKLIKIIKTNWTKILSVFFFIILCGAYAYTFALPPETKYSAGETLDPTCIPGSTNCSVELTTTETDPIVGALTGIIKSDGAGNISTAVSGTDIKTINGSSILGSGDISIGSASSPITVVNSTNLFSTGLTGTGSGVTTISGSIFLGEYAGYEAINSGSSIFIGASSGYNANHAFISNFIGGLSGYEATNAEGSNFLGYDSGSGSSNAAYSNFIGTNAGAYSTNAWASNFFGTNAGDNAPNASNSIFIGTDAGLNDTVDNTSNNLSSILIGSFTNTGGYSNSILLGSSISGSPIANTKANQFMLADSITDVRWAGIEYTLPPRQGATNTVLTNDGTGVLTWESVSGGGGSSLWSLNGDDIYYNDGKVGIGTDSPTAMLDIQLSSSTFYYQQFDESDKLGDSLDDATYSGTYTGTSTNDEIYVWIDSTGSPNTFSYADRNEECSEVNNVPITGGVQNLCLGISIQFENITGHSLDDQWIYYIVPGFNSPLSVSDTSDNVYIDFNPNLSNFFVGYQAGYDLNNNTTHGVNALGYQAGYMATGANVSNFIGYNAGNGATDAENSNFIGDEAGNGAVNAYESNFFGLSAGSGAEDASNSIFIGTYAGFGDIVDNTADYNDWSILIGYNTTTGGFSNSILLGGADSDMTPISNTKANQFMLADTITDVRWSGVEYTLPPRQGASSTVLTNDGNGVLTWEAVSGGGSGLLSDLDFNTVGGTGAGLNLDTGAQYNTFLGYQAGRLDPSSNNAADNNTAIGAQSLYSNTTGNQNSALGMNSLHRNTTGNQNSSIGYDSLYSNTTGSYNSAFGANSLYSNTTANYNSAFGLFSLYSNTEGNSNTAIGINSLYSNITGGSNSALGFSSLSDNTTGHQNSAVGVNSLFLNTTGSNNSAIGYDSLYSNTTGNYNSALGVFAGRYTADVMVGNETGNNSIFIGYDTRAHANGETNQIVIGSEAIGHGSNTAQWGNTSITNHYLSGFVQFSTYSTGTLMTDASGNITASSDERLKDIEGNFDNGGNALDIINSINPILYKWNDISGFDQTTTYAGFSAQNIESLIPEAVGKDKKGYLTLSDRPILATAINAIKELDLEVKEFASIDLDNSNSFVSLMKDYLSNVGNKLEIVFFGEVHTQKLCLDDVCIDKEQLRELLNNNNITNNSGSANTNTGNEVSNEGDVNADTDASADDSIEESITTVDGELDTDSDVGTATPTLEEPLPEPAGEVPTENVVINEVQG